MHASKFSLRPGAIVIGSLALALGGVSSFADTKQTDAFPTFDSYIKITGQSASVTGNDASYARRLQTPANGAYGIEALHFSKDLDKETAMEVNGRALSGSEDYLAQLKLTKNETGSVDVGYKRFRTFYDGIGGFFPLNGAWKPLANEELHTDRAKFWAEVNIARPNAPVFQLRYTNELRSGRKDSTIWGDSDFTGVPIYSLSSLNPISAARKLVAAYMDLNERQELLEASMKHSVGNTDFEFVISNNRTNSIDTRYINRYPGELKPFPTIPSSPVILVDPSLANNPNTGYDTAKTNAKVMNYMGKFTTKVSDTFNVFGGVNYQHATADIGGDRQIGLTINTATGPVTAVGGFVANGRPPYSYRTDYGSTKENVFTANLGGSYKPTKDLFVNLALKGESLDMSGVNQVTYINNLIVQATGAVTPILVAAPNTSKRNETSWVPELDVRYTGIKNVSLYGTFDYRYAPGEEVGTSTGVGPSGSAIIQSVASSSDNVKENHGHYKVGANWTISPMTTVRAEVFYKDHTNKYSGFGTSVGGLYVMGYEFYGTKLTAIVKPLSNLTFTTRYVRQTGTMTTETDTAAQYDSMDSKNHMFGETIDWTPNAQVYVQANVNVVFSTTSTGYPRSGGTANDVLQNADNNYTNGSLVTGFVVDKETDAQLQYTWYKTNNFRPAVWVGLPYGSSVNEYTVTLGLKHKFSDRIMGNAKVGYFNSDSEMTGGKTNFKGPLAYVSLDYAL